VAPGQDEERGRHLNTLWPLKKMRKTFKHTVAPEEDEKRGRHLNTLWPLKKMRREEEI
jgi:hypothetical protein